MIGGDWEVVRQAHDSSIMKAENSMGKLINVKIMENWEIMIKINRRNII